MIAREVGLVDHDQVRTLDLLEKELHHLLIEVNRLSGGQAARHLVRVRVRVRVVTLTLTLTRSGGQAARHLRVNGLRPFAECIGCCEEPGQGLRVDQRYRAVHHDARRQQPRLRCTARGEAARRPVRLHADQVRLHAEVR